MKSHQKRLSKMRLGIRLTIVVSLLATMPGFAQIAPARSTSIQEVVVTAQKREQPIQSVGITLSAFSGDELESFRRGSLSEITDLVSNTLLFEDYGSGLPTWIIRGVGLQDFNANNTPTAAIYIDEVYQTSAAMGEVGLFDIDRVEILKGPQGGLYGRNTSGGAINVLTLQPQFDDHQAYLNLSYSSWQRIELEAASNFKLTDNLALRLAGKHQTSSDGWQRSLVNDQTYGELDRSDIRATLLFEPNENISLKLKVYAGEDNSELILGRSVGAYASNGDLCSAVQQGFRDESTCLDWGSVNRLANADSAFDLSLQAVNAETVLSNPVNQNDHDYHGINAELSVNFESITLTSISVFEKFDYGVFLDLDASNGEFGHRPSSSDIEVWSQEFRLSSTEDRVFQWLAGLVISNDYFSEERSFLLGDNLLIGLNRGDLSYRQTTQSRALYGQFNFQANENFSVNLDFRYTDESKKYRGGTFFVPSFSLFFIQGASSDYELDDNFSGKAQLNWQAQDDILFYGSVSKGFKSGGFYGGFPFNLEEILPYKEESILAYELGFKSNFLDGNLLLNGAVFFYDYKDVQGFVSETNVITMTVIDRLANQGNAEHQGLELELEWMANNDLYFALNLGYLDARITESSQLTTNISGDMVSLVGKRAYAPNWNNNFLIGFNGNITDSWRFKSMFEYHYRSEFSGNLTSLADQAILKLPGYGLSNLYLSLIPDGKNLELSFWVKNLTDKNYRTRTKSDGLLSYMDIFGEPRSYGASIKLSW
ncbi:MAG: hypothetical protein COA71_00665 [SAR86 cluster bacterium]|uniref:TonB-dependent receptor n=1 Tax=SAR86 cluster bacterium TaxID=2030880 RepID=A0A2A5CIS0_9GAMM|nr:MAG: hypothetical protein COA71_00665 [SAR86 cluster bacterium]